MPSIRQIAQEAGVSISTVSRALNNDAVVNPKTRERVLAIANRAGYVATMGRRVTTNVGFAFTGEITLAHAFDSAVLAGVVRGLDEARFNVVVLNIQRDKDRDETFTQFFMRMGVRGVVLRTTSETSAACRAVAEEGFPHVVISDRFDDPHVNYVDCDSRPDTKRAIDYLVSLGHRRIAFALHNVPDRDHEDRLEGYREALARHTIAYREDLVFRHRNSLAGGASVLDVAISMPNRPTAIFFADSNLAVGAVNQAQKLGVRVPEDISLIVVDDTQVRYSVHPTLTAVCQDAAALGFEAALWLTRRVTGNVGGHLRKTIPTSFEVNGSTGASPSEEPRRAVEAEHTVSAPVAER